MELVQLIYCSQSRESINAELIDEILSTAHIKNKVMNITGVLCHDNKHFIQCLEGDYQEVNNIYNKIVRDDRHGNITLLSYKATDSRIFPDWSMGYINDQPFLNFAIERVTNTGAFSPAKMLGAIATEFIYELKKYKPE